MKTFIFQILQFISLYLFFSIVISISVPYHWGNPWYSSKLQFLEADSQTQFNTYFWGSSRIYRQVSPSVFDSVLNTGVTERVTSFNFGSSATFCPQSYYLYEQFLESNLSNTAKNCFVELMEIDKINDFFLHQERTTYWQNASDVIFVSKSFLYDATMNFPQKFKAISNYGISYFENILHLGHFGQQLITSNYYKEEYTGPAKDGFFPLELEAATTTDPTVKDHLLERRLVIEDDSSAIIDRKQAVLTYRRNISASCDLVNLERIRQLIQKSAEKGIKLTFILSPRNASQELINLAQQIPPENVIDMSDPFKFPELYRHTNSFDVGHLNTKGSRIYSEKLAEEFQRIQKGVILAF